MEADVAKLMSSLIKFLTFIHMRLDGSEEVD